MKAFQINGGCAIITECWLLLVLAKPNMPPFQSWALEVEDKSNLQPCDTEIVQHAADLNIADAFDRLCVNHYSPFNDKIRDVFADKLRSVVYREARLLFEANARGLHFDAQGVLIWLFMQAMAK